MRNAYRFFTFIAINWASLHHTSDFCNSSVLQCMFTNANFICFREIWVWDTAFANVVIAVVVTSIVAMLNAYRFFTFIAINWVSLHYTSDFCNSSVLQCMFTNANLIGFVSTKVKSNYLLFLNWHLWELLYKILRVYWSFWIFYIFQPLY